MAIIRRLSPVGANRMTYMEPSGHVQETSSANLLPAVCASQFLKLRCGWCPTPPIADLLPILTVTIHVHILVWQLVVLQHSYIACRPNGRKHLTSCRKTLGWRTLSCDWRTAATCSFPYWAFEIFRKIGGPSVQLSKTSQILILRMKIIFIYKAFRRLRIFSTQIQALTNREYHLSWIVAVDRGRWRYSRNCARSPSLNSLRPAIKRNGHERFFG